MAAASNLPIYRPHLETIFPDVVNMGIENLRVQIGGQIL
jgi:hypothetical protein